MKSLPISPEIGHGRQSLWPHISIRFGPGRCDLCQESIGRHIPCGQHIKCPGFTGTSLLSLQHCFYAFSWNHPPCNISHKCSTHGHRILMSWSISLALPFIGLSSPKASPEPSGMMAQRGSPGWAGSMPQATITISGCFACCCEGSRDACRHQLPLLLRSLNDWQEKHICLSGRAQLEATPVFPSFYQEVENKLSDYLFFIYVHENSHFSL